jgi:hypothetical protein
MDAVLHRGSSESPSGLRWFYAAGGFVKVSLLELEQLVDELATDRSVPRM